MKNDAPASSRKATIGRTGRARPLIGALKVVHPYPVAVVLATSVILLVIAFKGLPSASELWRALVVVLASQVATGALNDYVDRHSDAARQPDKPIPSGLLSARTALAMAGISCLLLVVFAATFGSASVLLAATALAGGIAYDLWLKPTPFAVAGYMIGFLSLTTWFWYIAGHLTPPFLALYPAGALLLLAAHLAQSFPDIETDRELGLRGAAVILGPVGTLRAIEGIYVAAVATVFILAVFTGSLLTLFLATASGGLGLAALLTCRNAAYAMDERERLFRVLAPGMGLMAAGCLIALAP